MEICRDGVHSPTLAWGAFFLTEAGGRPHPLPFSLVGARRPSKQAAMPYLKIRRHRVHYQWQGGHDPARESAVFLHDGLGAIGSWKDLPGRLGSACGLNALVYDRWGYGRSDPRSAFPYEFMEREVPALEALLDQLGLARVHLIGHSDGGSIALLFAARFPQRVHKVVTEAAHVFVEPETRAGIRALLAAQAAGATPPWLAKLHGRRAEALLSAWCRGWLTDAHSRWRIDGRLGGVRAPVLAIQGRNDEFGTGAQVRAIVEGVAGPGKSWLVKDCGHTPHNQAPEEFLRRVGTFLRGEARK